MSNSAISNDYISPNPSAIADAAEIPAVGAVTGEISSIPLQTGNLESATGLTVVGEVAPALPVYFSRNPGDGLMDFLMRPRPIYTFDWTTGSAITSIRPWTRFLTNTQVAQKLNNFYLIRGTLHIVGMVSSQPQLTGGLRVSYLPYQSGNTARMSTFNSCFPPQTFHLNASDSGGFEFRCPFFYPDDWQVIRYTNTAVTNADDLGELFFCPIATLARADGIAPGTLSVQIYAWMTDVQLSGPTFVTQASVVKSRPKSSEENATGPISSVASTVAKVSGMLKEVPVIGPIASAFEIGSSAVGSIARLFGFSRPVPVDELNAIIVRSYGNPSVGIGRDHVNKLTLDPKQNITVDPRSVGLPPEEMSGILSIAGQESQLLRTTWDTTQVHKASIVGWFVNPTSVSSTTYPTNLAWVSVPFRNWTGSIIYRIRVFSSPFQRGRLIIVYDPCAGSGGAPALGSQDTDTLLSTNRACVLDISEDTDYEFRVGWCQPQQWGYVPTIASYVTSGGAQNNNGAINIFVDSPLLSPAATSVGILVTVRAGDDFQLANPNPALLQDFVVQSLVVTSPPKKGEKAQTTCEIMPTRVDGEASAAAHYGEKIVSARTLAHRYSLLCTVPFPLNVTAAARTYRDSFFKLFSVPIPGSTTDFSTNSAMFGNQVIKWTYAAWWASFHSGMRGGMRYKIVHNIPPTNKVIFAIVRNTTNQTTGLGTAMTPIPLAGNWLQGGAGTSPQDFDYFSYRSGNGLMLIDAHQPGGVEFEIPWAQISKMVPTSSNADFAYPCFEVHILSNQTYTPTGLWMHIYSAIAEDFAPFYFVGAPGFITANGYPGTPSAITG